MPNIIQIYEVPNVILGGLRAQDSSRGLRGVMNQG